MGDILDPDLHDDMVVNVHCQQSQYQLKLLESELKVLQNTRVNDYHTKPLVTKRPLDKTSTGQSVHSRKWSL